MSRSLEGAVALGGRTLALLVLSIASASCGGGGAAQIHDAASLPEHISVCGRTWTKDVLERELSLDKIRTVAGVEPVVVDPGLGAPCPAGPCTAVAKDGPCHTVVYVRVGEDAYLDYELSGGP